MFLHSWSPTPIFATFGPFQLHWYGLMLAIGALAGLAVCVWLAKKYGVAESHIYDLFFFFLIFGFIGARLYHVSNEWAYYGANLSDIVKVWNGGLALHGGLIAGVFVLIIYSKKHNLSFWRLADIFALGLILGQAIGRWGNYFNQELFGQPTSWPWGIPINLGNRPVGYEQFNFFHPTFLYESAGSFIIFGLLLWLHLRRIRRSETKIAPGTIILLYFVVYSVLRISTESLRLDHTPIFFGLRLPIISSLLLIGAAISLWLFRRHQLHQSTHHGSTTS